MEYYKEWLGYGDAHRYVLKRLRRTGKCKVVTLAGVKTEYVQHKGIIFKRWVEIKDIVTRTEKVFSCKEKQVRVFLKEEEDVSIFHNR